MSIHAVLIAIERYDCNQDGIHLDLDGPASDAVRFARLLLGRGVPPANIHLFLNALDLPARTAELCAFPGGDEIRIEAPVRDVIENFFDNVLGTLDGGTLYLHWGGHGVMRDGLERHLFYQNIRQAAPLTFLLDQRLARLRRLRNFSTQNIFVDACANYVELTQFPGLAPTQLAPGGPIQFVTQDVLCAAASGERAGNDPIRRTGLFTSSLLEQFHQVAGWPAGKELAPRIEAAFIERAKTDANYRLRPVWLRFVADDGSTIDRGGVPRGPQLQGLAELAGCAMSQIDRLTAVMMESLGRDVSLRDSLYDRIVGHPDRSFRGDAADDCAALAAWTLLKSKTDDLRLELVARGIADVGLLMAEFQRVQRAAEAYSYLKRVALTSSGYEKIFRRMEPSEPGAHTLEEILNVLSAKGPASRSRLFRFVLEVAQIVNDNVLQQELLEWCRRHADASYVADIRNEITCKQDFRILLSVSDSPKRAWGIRLRNGVVESRRRERPLVGDTDLLPALESLYEELISDLNSDNVSSVEIILKLDQLQLNLEKSGIPLAAGLPTEPLCERLPVALRWRDRILRPIPYRKREWQEAARNIGALGRRLKVYRLPLPVAKDQWRLPPAGHLLDLVQVQGDDGSTLALTLFHGGVPYACWHRSTAPAGYAHAVEEFAQSVQSFEDVPRILPGERGRRPEVQALALFWDDPASDPVDLIKSYEEPK